MAKNLKGGFQGSSRDSTSVSKGIPRTEQQEKDLFKLWLRQECDTITPPAHGHLAPTPVFPWTFWPPLVSFIFSLCAQSCSCCVVA